MQALKVAAVAVGLAALPLLPAHACDFGDYHAQATTQSPVAAAPATPDATAAPTSVAQAPAQVTPAESVVATSPTQTAATTTAVPPATRPN